MPDFVDLLLDTVFLVDAGGHVVYVNAACERMFGYTPAEFIGQRLLDFVAAEDRARTLEEARQVMAGRPRIGFENRYIRRDGRQVHVMWSACWSERDQLRIGVARDVTELRRAEAIQLATYAISEAAHNAGDLGVLLSEIHRIIATLVPMAGFAVATCDRGTRQLSFSCQMDRDGKSLLVDETLACQSWAEVICAGHPMPPREAAPAALSGDVASGDDGNCWLVMPLVAQQETIGALALRSDPDTRFSDKDKELLHFVSEQVAIAIDRAQMKAELLRAAQYDELTGLPNRRLFQDRIRSAVARCVRKQGSLAVLYVDVDDFKQVNDSLGHASGDLLLREVARRLQLCVRESDTVARLGGDEFVVLLEDVQRQEDAEAVADKIREAMRQPMEIDGRAMWILASIGIALYPEHGREIEQLLTYADEAMYSDKRSKAS